MSTQTEAMKRWVEVFDGNWHDEPVDSEWADRAHQALAEMRQAIAEAEQPAQTCSRHAEAERLADQLEDPVNAKLYLAPYIAAELRRLVSLNKDLMDEVARLQKVEDADRAYELLRRAETEMRYAGWNRLLTDNYARKDIYDDIKEFLK
jgi:hypothetical protein